MNGHIALATTKLLTYRGTVYPWHCDHMGHMNVMHYAGKFDEASWSLLAAIGVTASYLRDAVSGVAVVQQNVAYKRELLPGTVIEIWSRMVDVGEKKLIFMHEMFDAENGGLCATCELTGVHVDPVSRRSVPLPAAVRASAQAMMREIEVS